MPRLLALLLISLAATLPAQDTQLQPWPENPRFWQYQGQPTRLVGGSKDDNPFQMPHVEKHLDEIAAAGNGWHAFAPA